MDVLVQEGMGILLCLYLLSCLPKGDYMGPPILVKGNLNSDYQFKYQFVPETSSHTHTKGFFTR